MDALDAIERVIERAMASQGITWEQLMIEYIKWQNDPESLRQFIAYIKSFPHNGGGEPRGFNVGKPWGRVFPTMVGVNRWVNRVFRRFMPFSPQWWG